jgi:Domain of unknown function (DUF4402)
MGDRVSHFALGAAVAVTPFGLWTSDALGQTYSITNFTPPIGTMGTLAAQSGSTVTVTLTPGGAFSPSGNVMHSSNANYTVTVTCTDGGTSLSFKKCTSHDMLVVVSGSGTLSGSTRIGTFGDFVIGNSSQTTVGSPVIGSTSSTYTLSALGNTKTGTFEIGFDIPLLTSGTTGVATTRTFTVAVGTTSGTTSTSTGKLVGTIFNPIGVTSTANMTFGQILTPASGTATYTLSPAGTLTASGGGAAWIKGTVTPKAAAFKVTGEGAQAFQLTVPSNFTMAGPGGSLTVTTTTSFGGSGTMTTQSFLGSIGTLGSYPFQVGGLLPVAAGTSSGTYTGVLQVSVSYN